MYLVFALAHAGGFYNPMDIANESERFTSASTALQAPVAAAQSAAQARSLALVDHELALDLLGSRVIDAEREHHAVLRHEYQRGFSGLQSFTDTFVMDFDAAFTGAMQRVLSATDGLTDCPREVQQGQTLPGLPSRWVANPACIGPDRNGELAAKIDADASLQAELDALLSRPWPDLSDADGPGAPLDGATQWVDLSRVADAFLQSLVQSTARSEATEQSRLELERTEGADDGYVEQLQSLRAMTAKQRSEGAAGLLQAIERAFAAETKRSGISTSWCPRPRSLGGCVGADVTDAWLTTIETDRKIQKAR
jgi:hypothetical protein